tara:strand:+ start:954 stop:1355 length:402 start_codon:yes stop_codon:yes gene_type:complete
MKQILAIVRQLLTEVKDVTQESMDLNPTSFTKRSGFVQTVEWRVNHLLEELKEAINVENNGWETIVEINEKLEDRCESYEERLKLWRQLGNDRLLKIADREEKIAELLTIIDEKNELIDELNEGTNGISLFED